MWRPAAVHRILAGSLAAATVLNAFWFVLPAMRTDLRVGYYLWLAAFAVGSGAAWSRRVNGPTSQVDIYRRAYLD